MPKHLCAPPSHLKIFSLFHSHLLSSPAAAKTSVDVAPIPCTKTTPNSITMRASLAAMGTCGCISEGADDGFWPTEPPNVNTKLSRQFIYSLQWPVAHLNPTSGVALKLPHWSPSAHIQRRHRSTPNLLDHISGSSLCYWP